MKYESLLSILGYSSLVLGWIFGWGLKLENFGLMFSSMALGIFISNIIYIYIFASVAISEPGVKK